MSKAHYKLDIDTRGALRYDLNLYELMGGKPERSHWLWWPSEHEMTKVFHQHWLAYLATKRLTPTGVLLFYKSPNHNTSVFPDGIHIDAMPVEEYKQQKLQEKSFVHYSINLVANPGYLTGNGHAPEYKDWKDNAVMRWYKHTNTQASKVLTFQTPDNNSYRHRECHPDVINDLLDLQEDCNYATLVNTSLPHEVETFDKPRLCFSLRGITQLRNRKIADWQDVVNFFNEYNLIVE